MKQAINCVKSTIGRLRTGSAAYIGRRHQQVRRSGAAMVEMALILPLLLLFTFGIIEYGWMFFRLSQVNLAARHGVRAAVRPAATEAEMQGAVDHVMNGAGWNNSPTVQYTIDPCNLAVAVGEPVRVHVVVNTQYVALTGLLPMPTYIGGNATMAKEGPE